MFVSLILSVSLLAAENALIIEDRAIIYADPEMKHPIGYLPKWKQVRVGSVSRNGGRVLPIALSKNKIGYISVFHISMGRDVVSVKSSYLKFASTNLDKTKRNNINLHYSLFYGAAAISDDSFGTDTVSLYFNSFGYTQNIYFNSHWVWNWSLDYESASASDGTSITSFFGRVGLKYKLKAIKKFRMSLSGAVGFAPYTAMETDVFVATGYNLSMVAGVEGKIGLSNRIDMTGFMGMELQKIFGLDLPIGLGEFNPYVVGLKFHMGFSFYY